jgi:hypothetical protein
MGAIMTHEIGGRQTPQAFVHGLSIALEVAAVIAIAGAVVAAATIRSHVGHAEVTPQAPAPPATLLPEQAFGSSR